MKKVLKDLVNVESYSKNYKETHKVLSFDEYLDEVQSNPNIIRDSYQRMCDLILSYGSEDVDWYGQTIPHYKFFDDPFENGKDAIFGIDTSLLKIVDFFKAASKGYGAEKRILLLHGPVGSAKSSIARLMKKGLEYYSQQDEGKLYTFQWVIDKNMTNKEELLDILGGEFSVNCPLHEEPLKLIPQKTMDGSTPRKEFIKSLNLKDTKYSSMRVEGDLNPHCDFILNKFLEYYDGDYIKVLNNHIKVKRMIISEKDRMGIGTFQPKDEKNQDSTELTGDINYKKIIQYGTDSDPRAFNFDGEFCIANRGVVEFIEMLKLDVAFLYDLLSASQEKKIKPKKFPQASIDEVIIGHTNEPEYRKLQNNEFMEALNDRTVKIDIPYITKLEDEVRIYKKDFTEEKLNLSIAPHTLKVASIFSILTRMEDSKRQDLSSVDKMQLYNGKIFANYKNDDVLDLREEAKREGLEGISPRYIQDKISNAVVKSEKEGYLSPFTVMNELKAGLKHHGLVSEEKQELYEHKIAEANSLLVQLLKQDVRKAISFNEDSIKILCDKYISNVKAFTNKENIRNKYSNKMEDPDENFMRSIESEIDIPESMKNDFRQEIMNYIGALAIEGKGFDYKSNEKLCLAFENKLFNDQKDSLKISTITSNVVDKKMQEKIDVIKTRLVKDMGYCDSSATDTLNFVADILKKES